MFSGLEIAKASDFKQHLNKYDVLHIDIQWFLANCENADEVVSFITKSVLAELRETYPGTLSTEVVRLPDALSRVKERTGQKFIVIIDEWDVLIRDGEVSETIQDDYINFLRGMFKGTEPTKYIQLAYLTGILPIKKEKAQSAVNNLDEFTMLQAFGLAPYIDVITYLIHLGYLGYNEENGTAFVPNEEIRQELSTAVRNSHWDEMVAFQQESRKLLMATLAKNENRVAQEIEKIHNDYVSIIQYNNENSLSSVLAIAYLGAMQYYFKPVREMPTGYGFADLVFVPKPEYVTPTWYAGGLFLISDFNTDLYYQNPDYLEWSYREGRLLD